MDDTPNAEPNVEPTPAEPEVEPPDPGAPAGRPARHGDLPRDDRPACRSAATAASRRSTARASTSQPVALITQRSNETEEINSVDELYSIGTLAKIAQVIRLQDGTIRAIVQGQRRIRLLDLVQTEPHLEARVELIEEEPRRRASRSRP